MVYSAIAAYKIQAFYYIIVFAVITLIGMLFYKGSFGFAFFKKEKRVEVDSEEFLLVREGTPDDAETSAE